MSRARVPNRWFIVVAGILVQLCLGAIYAWSAFTGKLTDANGPYQFSRTQTQIVFSVGLLTFAVVMALIAGNWQKKVGARFVSSVGGFVLGLGYVIAGLAGSSFWGILLGIGLLGGAGIGLSYVCPIAILMRWFPDKKGMITGLAVAGFGFGALLWIKLTTGFKFGPIDLTPGWSGLFGMGWSPSNVFILYGILFGLIVISSSQLLVGPPEGWVPPGWTPPKCDGTAGAGATEFSPREMVRTSSFWLLFFTFLVSATAGLMVIGVIQLFTKDRLTAAGFSTERATEIAGTAMGLFFALFNGLGRILWGTISDWIGRKTAIVLMCLTQAVALLGFYSLGGYELGLYIGCIILGFNFGGNFALFPSATADYFGNRSVGVNYPWVFLAYGVGGVVGPVLGGVMGDLRAWLWAFIPATVALLVMGIIDEVALKPPMHPKSATS